MRRSGKTFYVFQRINSLFEQGVPRNRILYFDFSDSRLPLGPHVMDEVADEYWRQVPQARGEGAYLFFDEVQDCEGWQGTARRLAENERVTLVLTGSSSKLSSDQIATEFRGRSHVHELLPCSFGEYLRFHGDMLPDSLRGMAETGGRGGGRQGGDRLDSGGLDGSEHTPAAFSPAERTALEALFDAYLVTGGFPGVQGDTPSTRVEILQGYVRDVVARDVADRVERPSIPLAEQMALIILRSTSNETSVKGTVDALRGLGFRIGWEKADELFGLFRQAYLFFEVREYARGAVGTTSPPKVYAVDPGLAYAVSRAAQEDVGNRLETAVYLELRRRMAGRRTDVVASWAEPDGPRRKVDFVVGEAYAGEHDPAAPYALYQVAAEIDAPKTRKREVGSLDAAMGRTRLDHGTVITLRDEETIASEHGSIEVVPAWRWFLA